jgi:aryl-alcohol dehydrogenase-like predicted oxidoreductase
MIAGVTPRRSLGPFSVAPVGFGAMRLTGPNVFGPPKDRGEAIRVLRAAVAGGVNHIDTAQFYGPDENLKASGVTIDDEAMRRLSTL